MRGPTAIGGDKHPEQLSQDRRSVGTFSQDYAVAERYPTIRAKPTWHRNATEALLCRLA